jgi:hypothetical protein
MLERPETASSPRLSVPKGAIDVDGEPVARKRDVHAAKGSHVLSTEVQSALAKRECESPFRCGAERPN